MSLAQTKQSFPHSLSQTCIQNLLDLHKKRNGCPRVQALVRVLRNVYTHVFHEKRNECTRVHALEQILIDVYTHVYTGALTQSARLYHLPFSVAQAKQTLLPSPGEDETLHERM